LKILIHFLRLIRWPNLLFILLAEGLFHFCIYKPLYPLAVEAIEFRFYVMLLSNILIAAAGYMINDYFDVNMDQINKPKKVVVGAFINRRWVLFWHLILNSFAIYISLLVFPFKSYWHIHLANLFAIMLLWFYTTNFKKKFLIGNVIISALTAWSIAVVYFSKLTIQEVVHPNISDRENLKFAKLTLLYSAFAFILSLIREALKDIEDREGDEKFGWVTLPIKWGLKPTKVYLSVWLIVVISVLLIIQLGVIPYGWWFSAVYCIIFIVTPLFIVLYKLPQAYTSKHFKELSNWVKVAMLFGILSILFFYFLF